MLCLIRMIDTTHCKNMFRWSVLAWMITTLACLPIFVTATECEYKTAHTAADCSNRNLNFVPSVLHKRINSLDLSGNNFPVLENDSFFKYVSLRQLFLRNNSLHTIKGGAFQNLNYLSILDLSNNKLTKIPADPLKIISHSLENLNLAGNKLYTIQANIFSNLEKLTQLDLSGNSIHQVDRQAFFGLSSLVVFKIRHNALTSLPRDTFADFPEEMTQVQLYDNRWLCDCHLRWLWLWLNATDSAIWQSPGYRIRCDGPAFIKDKPLDSIALNDLACMVKMKKSGSTRELPNGANTTLLCSYTSIPETNAVWRKNSEVIDFQKDAKKYSVSTWASEEDGIKTHFSELTIRHFKYYDIAKYDCHVENIRGAAAIEYRLTLAGVDFDSVVMKEVTGQASSSGVDTLSIVIAVAVVSGIILLIVIIVLMTYSVNRVQRKRKEKRDTIQENIKQHFMNSEAGSNGDSPDGKAFKAKSMNEGRTDTIDSRGKFDTTMDSTYKPPLDLDETEQMYPFEQPVSPALTNGNTYVSFGSGLTDPSEFMPPQHPYSQSHPARYDGSHAGSATPLLDRNTPSLYDSEEPMEDYAQYPVYDSVTNSLQHPHLPNSSFTYGENGHGHLPNRQSSIASYASLGRNGIGDRSFQYPPSLNGSMPRTPGSTRSGMAFAPRSVEGDVSPLNDAYANPYQTRPLPQQPNNYNKYNMDYKDVKYPATTTTPPPHRMTPNTQKSLSVGNLGYSPVATSAPSSGPRKPPRIYQSREYMELTPHDTSSDYITSADAQNYSQSYGITPGTPV